MKEESSRRPSSEPESPQNGAGFSLARSPWLGWLLCLTVFLTAFLLFQVQPLISKAILPWYGGSPTVWTTSMLFFQVLLFAGYAYTHFSTRWLTAPVQGAVHAALIIAAIASLPILPGQQWEPDPGSEPVGQILVLLTVHLGLPFFVLSSTAPLIQVWWDRAGGGEPYRLYALSNAGSLLALITYPFLFVRLLGIVQQGEFWAAGFVLAGVMLLVCVAIAWWLPRAEASTGSRSRQEATGQGGDVRAQSEEAPTVEHRVLWLLFPACGSALYLAMTNHLCRDVAVVPFLWVAPLALYLLSYVVAFARGSWYHRGAVAVAMFTAMYFSAALYRSMFIRSFAVILAIQFTALFAGCLMCHGELARLKPAPRYLTKFYLYLSAGGALGGLFVSLVAPKLFANYYEYPILLIACWLLLLGVYYFDTASPLRRGRRIWAWFLLIGVFAPFVGLLSNGIVGRRDDMVLVARSFFGTVRVVQRPKKDPADEVRQLYHGIIQHGSQFVDEEKAHLATTYYTETSGLGYAFDQLDGRPNRRFGIVGLGVGTVGAYAKQGDEFRIYEINPDVVLLAEHAFNFLDLIESRGATYEVVLGDARLSLAREKDQAFDLLVLDAFSGDAIPVHLLTLEAFGVYARHLKPDGILAVHISNKYLDLLPVVLGAASQHELKVLMVDDKPDAKAQRGTQSRWLLVGRPDILAPFATYPSVRAPGEDHRRTVWTDDFSNLFEVLK